MINSRAIGDVSRMEESLLQRQRRDYVLLLPKILDDLTAVEFNKSAPVIVSKDSEALKKLFPKTYEQPLVSAKKGIQRLKKPLRVGVVFSGGQAAGGHNVIAGLFDALKKLDSESCLFGFLNGPNGIIDNKYQELTEELIAFYRNQGGFELIGSGRAKIETDAQLESSLKAVSSLNLDGLVIIGGDDSNTNAAVLAEYFLQKGCSAKVIGVPKTIDGDLKNAHVSISFGFDTACKCYSEMIGNIARDALSAKKYYHFIKLMGRSASHIALECALATQPNYTWIGEEVAAKKMTLKQIVDIMKDLIEKRAEIGKTYGVILIPEGLIEFIPEIGALIRELNALGEVPDVRATLSTDALACFDMLPSDIQQQLLLDRDPHGNVQVSLIETERLLIEMIKRSYSGKFSAVSHFFGYEGRAAFPSNFDSHYCYALGCTAALLIDEGLTGYMCCIKNLVEPVEKWEIGGIPLTMLMHLEMRKGKMKPVIQKALVNLKGNPFQRFSRIREDLMLQDTYRFPGPMQFFGNKSLTDTIPITLIEET
ncbi:MAG: diphosphate--fructose-6-phosphate 1-phosphotransferase [Chlamydiota bacterium]